MNGLDESGQSTSVTGRITNLDTVRGVAVLGILVMNAVSYGLPSAAYYNLDAAGSKTWLDWTIGVGGEVLVDQKAMALFSMLFGAGIVLFADRAAAKGRRPVALSLWRNLLLLLIGIGHSLIWEGDILVVYALCAPLLIAVRRRSPRLLIAIGVVVVLWSAVVAVLVQQTVPADGAGLGDYWYTDGSSMSDAVGLFLLNDFFARALGMMLVGVGLARVGVLDGARPVGFYRRMAVWGLVVGLPLAAVGVIVQFAYDFSPDIAVISSVPNTVGTIPLALGYLGCVTLWDKRPTTEAHERVRAAGRMALTNYLTQTLLGLLILDVLLDPDSMTRTTVAIVVVVIWAVQLAWSKPWLQRFRYGPFEWIWRCATYRRIQPLRRS